MMPATYANRYSRDTASDRASANGMSLLNVAAMLSATILALCPGCSKPPDLTMCTCLEVRYSNGALDYFFPHSFWQESILSEKEREQVRSYDTWTVTDQQQIKAFARLVNHGRYRGRAHGVTETQANIVAYQGSDRKMSFAVHYTSIDMDRKYRFDYPPGFLNLATLDPPELKPLQARWNCCRNLGSLVVTLMEGLPHGHLYPDPNHWCDVIVARMRGHYTDNGELDNKADHVSPDAAIARLFTCPSVHASLQEDTARSGAQQTDPSSQTTRPWISTYTLNPNCSENSPQDVVFLFESKPGWNLHGGPELFTFDNHDPKGGLVFLNDGTAKFVRTEEELKQLRWK